MIIPDINLLIYCHDNTSQYHKMATDWYKKIFNNSSEPIGIPTIVSIGFVRLVCNPRVCTQPLEILQAEKIVKNWYYNGAILVEATSNHFEIFFELLKKSNGGGNMTTDAHIATLAIEHNATIHSNDADFRRFSGLKIFNPLEDKELSRNKTR